MKIKSIREKEILFLKSQGLNVCCGKPDIYRHCDGKTKSEALKTLHPHKK